MKQSALANPLRLLFWESTAQCNLACKYCRRVDVGGNGDLSYIQARGLIEQLAEVGCEQGFSPALIFSGGEPLLRGDIFDLISYAATMSVVPAIATNGTLVDDWVAGRLRGSGAVRAAISIDGASAATHDKIRGQDGSFAKAVAGAQAFHRAGLPSQLNFTLTRGNCDEITAVHALAESLGAVALHIFILVPVGCGRELNDADMLTAEEFEQKLTEIAGLAAVSRVQMKVTCGPHFERIVQQKGLVDILQARGGLSRGCLAGRSVLFVSHTGVVFPCGYLPVECGNILKSPLTAIRENSPQLAALRDSANLKGKCGICEYKRTCGGCRARAYAATGDMFAEEPSCAYIPRAKGVRA